MPKARAAPPYPVTVAVSAVTTFLTPYLIHLSDPLAARIAAALPEPVGRVLAAYSTWLANLRPQGDRAALGRIVRRSALQVLVNLALVAAVFLAGAYAGPRLEAAVGVRVEDDRVRNAVVWAAALAVSLPPPRRGRGEAEGRRAVYGRGTSDYGAPRDARREARARVTARLPAPGPSATSMGEMQRRLAVLLALLLLCAPAAGRVARALAPQSLAGRSQVAADARHDAPISCRANASAAATAFQAGARLATFGRDVVSPAAPNSAPARCGVIRSLRSARFHAKRPAARRRSSTDPPLAL